MKVLEKGGWLTSPRVKRALLKIDRADFVPEDYKESAYSDEPIPIGYQQTISQPAVVALMLQLLDPRPGQKIMDVGAGSGWQAALLSHLVGEKGKVIGMEVIPSLCELAKQNLAKYPITNVEVLCQNAREGLPSAAPFDGIIAGASGEEVPSAWKEQLKVGGRIVTPVGTDVVVLHKVTPEKFTEQIYPGFIFVPLV